MKFIILLLLTTLSFAQTITRTENADILSVKSIRAASTTLASRPCPVMTQVQRDALTPAQAFCVYNSTTQQLNVYDSVSTSWKSAGGGGISGWLTATSYVVGDVVIESNTIYICAIAHTSGTFATDLASSRWQQLAPSMANHALKANLASPTLTGTPLSTTASLNNNSTQIATTAYADRVGHIPSYVADGGPFGSNVLLATPTKRTVELQSSIENVIGINAGVDGQVVTLIFAGGGTVLVNQSPSAGLNNTINTGTGENMEIEYGQAVDLVYSVSSFSWMVIDPSAKDLSDPDTFLLIKGGTTYWSTGDSTSFLIGGGVLSGTFVNRIGQGLALDGQQSYRYTQAAGSLNDYFVSNAYVGGPVFAGKTVTLTFPYSYNGSDNDIEVIVYNANTNAIIPTSFFIKATTTGVFRGSFTMPASLGVGVQLRIGFHVKVLSSGKIFDFDDILVSADNTKFANLSSVGSWQTFTPTGNFTTNTTYTGGRWRQVGQNMEVQVSMSFSGAPNAANFNVNLPSGYVIDTTKLTDTGGNGSVLGVLEARDSGNADYVGVVTYETATSVSLHSNGAANQWTQAVPFSFGTSDSVHLSFSVPIVGFTSQVHAIAQTETFSTDSNSLTHKTSAVTSSDPIGTYSTYSYAASSNTKTVCATAPSTLPSVNDGFRIYSRAYNAASTCANPSMFVMQIGKGLKGLSLVLYKSIGKTTPMSLDMQIASSNTYQSGVTFKEYDETTGLLTFDAGYKPSGANTAHEFAAVDGSNNTQGYLTISASKVPAIAGITSPRSEVFVTGGSGHGSTNTKVRRFTNTQTSVGSDITNSGDSATLGHAFTINTDGVYSMTYCDGHSAQGHNHGITVNAATPATTSIFSLSDAISLGQVPVYVVNYKNCFSVTTNLKAGDIVRAQTEGSHNATTTYIVNFRITKDSF